MHTRPDPPVVCSRIQGMPDGGPRGGPMPHPVREEARGPVRTERGAPSGVASRGPQQDSRSQKEAAADRETRSERTATSDPPSARTSALDGRTKHDVAYLDV